VHQDEIAGAREGPQTGPNRIEPFGPAGNHRHHFFKPGAFQVTIRPQAAILGDHHHDGGHGGRPFQDAERPMEQGPPV